MIRHLLDSDYVTVQDWTFPAVRHLLRRNHATKMPTRGDFTSVLATSMIAEDNQGIPSGLVVACEPLFKQSGLERPSFVHPEVLSIYIRPESRGQGMGAALLHATEMEYRESHHSQINVTFTEPMGGLNLLSSFFAAMKWNALTPQKRIYAGTVNQMKRMPWFEAVPVGGLELIAWDDITPKMFAEARESNNACKWIPDELCPWLYQEDVHSVSSVGILEGEELVGWIQNHVLPSGVLRFTNAFIRAEFANRALLFPALSLSVRRAETVGCKGIVFAVYESNLPMIRFAQRRFAPWLSSIYQSKRFVCDLRKNSA